jgi:pimeloyl-ACP methyl ester carboxylesterase
MPVQYRSAAVAGVNVAYREAGDPASPAPSHDRTNPEQYPTWHQYLRRHQPATLIVWGAHDPIFASEGGKAFMRDVPDAELHLLNTGHFALEDHHDEIAGLIRAFYTTRVSRAVNTAA